jgi:hypothetical protein
MTFKVGGEVESYCAACKDFKWHVVVALVSGLPAKVECLGCHKHHMYRPSQPAKDTTAKAPRKSRAGSAPKASVDLDAAFSGRTARRYSPKEIFATDDVIDHPSFGLGLVVALQPGAQKMEVAFRDAKRWLVCARPPAQDVPNVK